MHRSGLTCWWRFVFVLFQGISYESNRKWRKKSPPFMHQANSSNYQISFFLIYDLITEKSVIAPNDAFCGQKRWRFFSFNVLNIVWEVGWTSPPTNILTCRSQFTSDQAKIICFRRLTDCSVHLWLPPPFLFFYQSSFWFSICLEISLLLISIWCLEDSFLHIFFRVCVYMYVYILST